MVWQMKDLLVLLSQVLLGWLVFQIVSISIFFISLRSTHSTYSHEKLPKTAVVLSLRGADPFLSNVLRALLHQNYPAYDLKIVVDNITDPAWNVAINVITEFGASNCSLSVLKNPLSTCSLKCSSIVQAVSELDASYQVVVLVDADAMVYTNWLRDLVSPLNSPKVGATTGNRWYLPDGIYWGSLVRYIWNVSAVIQMVLYQIAWGGSLAIKTEVIHQTGLIDIWKRAYADDTPLRSILKKHGWQIKFVPSVMLLNREECKLPNLVHWLRRQLFSSRLYHPFWFAVVADTVFTILIPNIVLLIGVVALVTRDLSTFISAVSYFAGYMIFLVIFILLIDKRIRSIISKRCEILPKSSPLTAFKLLIALPLTQWINAIAMVASHWAPTINWRGVTYRIKGRWNIKLTEYHPYQSSKSNNSKISL
ncbi:ceramide glucosyltransferase [Dulcicalothrix desertica PCC 7102]|uniref:Ceramide glucosyltransferase n=2 Tax=Dulcicalothrix desertica TaxID=32056 RepID=A0A3S1CS59_9CYAN|nr:ceramide glucosyltransferase [Dulcicalothrix desertica PCC 7102]TWH39735.1 cellulose synthase/poly-beta-1,6-N-acetylglucosamine synthase-like glycosyltransferase [Dulcicalothrix desertica PCC 7102]